MLISKQRLQASICEDSFYEFVKCFWDVVIPEDPIWNWHIKYLCDEVQYVMELMIQKKEKEYDLLINISPGSTKSTICSVMLTPWLWSRMPTARTINGSFAHMLALDLSRKSRIIVQSEKYKSLWPKCILSDDQNTKGNFVNTDGGGRLAVGTGGSITGFHAHAIVIDDPIDPRAAFSEAEMTNVNNWMRETLPTRKVEKKIVPTILIMQRLHENDPTGEWLERVEEGDIKHICLPAELDENINPPELAEKYIGGLMDPVRLSKNVLHAAEKDLGTYGYAGQFEQSPIPRGGGRFKTDLIQIEQFPPKHMIQKVRYWDKAGTKDGGCYTAGVLMGKDKNGFYWWLDVKIGQWDAAERESIIKQTAEIDGQNVLIGVEQEPGSGGLESAQNTIRNLAGYRVYADRPTGSKEDRAYPLEAQVNSGNTRMIRGEWNNAIINELRYWPKSKYKDQVDATSGSFAKLHAVKRRAGAL